MLQGGPTTALACPPSDHIQVGRCILDRLSRVGTGVKSFPVVAWAKAGKLGEYRVGAMMVAVPASSRVYACSAPHLEYRVVRCSV